MIVKKWQRSTSIPNCWKKKFKESCMTKNRILIYVENGTEYASKDDEIDIWHIMRVLTGVVKTLSHVPHQMIFTSGLVNGMIISAMEHARFHGNQMLHLQVMD